MSEIIIGCAWGCLCAVFTVAVPRTNQIMFLMGCGLWGSPKITTVALTTGYALYLGLSTGRELLDPHLSNDPFHRATVDLDNNHRINVNFVGIYKQQKIAGATLAIFIACIFVLFDIPLKSLEGLSYVGALVLIASFVRNCDRHHFAIDVGYLMMCLMLFTLVEKLKIANGVPLFGLAAFVLPSLIYEMFQFTDLKSVKVWTPREKMPDYTSLDFETSPYLSHALIQQQTKLGWLPTTIAVLFSFAAPGVSSSAWGNIWFKHSLGRRVVNASSETCIEFLGVLLAAQGLSYGGSFINSEVESINASFATDQVILLMFVSFTLLAASITFSLPLYRSIKLSLPRSMEFVVGAAFTSCLITAMCGFVGLLLCLLLGFFFFALENQNPDPHVRSFSFLPLILFR